MNREAKLTKRLYSNKTSSEWNRLIKDPFHRLEFDTTLRFLKKYLPKNGLILDAGGGPGRYTIELAKKGYDVILLDFVPANLELAKKQIKKAKVKDKIKSIEEGSIVDLSRFEDNTFDAVICLGGPLSHVHPEKDRQKAVSELIRVAKKDAPIFVSVMGKLGVLLATPDGWPQEIENKKHSQKLAYEGEDYMWCGEGYCHYFGLKELEKLFPNKKVEIIEKVGLEGLNVSNKITNYFAKEYPKAWKNWLEIHKRLCINPAIVDISPHMLIIVKKV